jgi:hypothetical protein
MTRVMMAVFILAAIFHRGHGVAETNNKAAKLRKQLWATLA